MPNLGDTVTYKILIFIGICATFINYFFIFPFLQKCFSVRLTRPVKQHSPQFFVGWIIIIPFILSFIGWHYLLNEVYKFSINTRGAS